MGAGEVDERRIVGVSAAPVLLPVGFLEKLIWRHVRCRQIVIQTSLPVPSEHLQAQRRLAVAIDERLEDAQGGFNMRAMAVLLPNVDHVHGQQRGHEILEADHVAGLGVQDLPFREGRGTVFGRQGLSPTGDQESGECERGEQNRATHRVCS